MIRFEYVQDGYGVMATNISYEIDSESSTDEVAEAFFRFMLAVGYDTEGIAGAMAAKAMEVLPDEDEV